MRGEAKGWEIRSRSESECEKCEKSRVADPKPRGSNYGQAEGRVKPVGGPNSNLLKKVVMTCD